MAPSSMHRAPYHSPNGGHHGHDGHFHNHVIIVNRFPFRGFPFVWGYPYIWPSNFDDWDNSDNCDSQQFGNDEPPQPSCDGSGLNQYKPQPDQYKARPDDQDDPPANEQPSSSSHRAPQHGAQDPPPPSGPVTLVLKHGGTLEYIYNYVMTPKTLTVLDEPRRVIPLDQIDLEASAIASAHAGVEFSRRVPSL